jgi:hypothetical protein
LFHAVVLSGQADVLERAPLLEALAQRCGQAGAMNWLSHIVNVSSFKRKKPYLVLMVREGAKRSALHLDDVHAAVFLFEYRIMGAPTGTFSADDWAGFRTVIAPEAERGAVAALAADAMLERGAHIVLVAYGDAGQAAAKLLPTSRHAMRWAWRTQPIAMELPLEDTMQATLAKLGRSTRYNLGYYRRRLAREMPCEFVADARGMLQEDELQAINAGSLNPVSPADFRRQYESSCQLPGGFLLGLRTLGGKWISLVGGWRQAGSTVHYWQMNTAGHEKLSIGKAMLSYFLEHEVSLRTKTLIYNGGTPNPIRFSFTPHDVTYLVVQSRSWRSRALNGITRMVNSFRSFVPINSLLAQTMCSKDLVWHSPKLDGPMLAAQKQQAAKAESEATAIRRKIESA